MSLVEEVLIAQARGWLSPTQNDALETLLDWVDNKPNVPAMTLGGLAGTGKSSVGAVLAMLLEVRGTRSAILSPTWRAANEFNDRLWGLNWGGEEHCTAQTIHSYLYSPVTNPKTGDILSWKRKKFEPPHSPRDILIIDEASMVDMLTFNDLSTLGARVLLIGDPAQLPPVSRGDGCMGHLDLFLTEPHRQALDSPILRLAYEVLEEGLLVPAMMSGEGLQVLPYSSLGKTALQWELNKEDWVVLSYTNQARVQVNSEVRAELYRDRGKPAPQPDEIGASDRLVSVKSRNSLYNSRIAEVVDVQASKDPREVSLLLNLNEATYQDTETLEVQALRAQFGNARTLTGRDLQDLKYDLEKPLPYLLDHGYAMTVHKAQGGGYDHVGLVLSGVNRLSYEDRRAFLYTAVTRAKKTLTLFL